LRSFANFEEDSDSLAGSHPGTRDGIRLVGLIEAVEDSDDLLHIFNCIAWRAGGFVTCVVASFGDGIRRRMDSLQ
jgi:hypothetical protein